MTFGSMENKFKKAQFQTEKSFDELLENDNT